MLRFSKPPCETAASRRKHTDTVRNMAAMTERQGLTTVPAAWPTGVQRLAMAVGTRPKVPVFKRAKLVKERG